MIRYLDMYRDGGTVSIGVSHFTPLELRYQTTEGLSKTPELVAAIEGCCLHERKEICIDNRCHDGNLLRGRWTIGYPTEPYAYEITDYSIKEWLLGKVQEFVERQRLYLNQVTKLTEEYVQTR